MRWEVKPETRATRRTGEAATVRPGPPAEVVVRAPDGRRELHETVTPQDGLATVELPAGWLRPGEHVVEVRMPGRPAELLRFVVAAE